MAQVRNELRKIKAKAAGPDGISARLLKSCADQLCRVVEHMFNMSLKLGRVPQLWKTSCVVPVTKHSNPKDLIQATDSWATVTSHLMKSLERLVLTHLCPLKFSDDSAIVGLITNEEHSKYRELIQDFVDWCLQNHLQINAGKTKELVVDFRSCKRPERVCCLDIQWKFILPSELQDREESGRLSSMYLQRCFYIVGLYSLPLAKYYYVFLCVVYAVTVLGNSFIMGTIYLARTLHTAKYIAVFNLALSDLCGSSALIPKLLDMFLFENQYIPYEACLANMFFVYVFMTLQSLTLLAMAYDRLIAICLPLRYHAIVTKTAMTSIICVMWILSMGVNGLLVGLVTRLSFCRSTTVNSYFCDHGPIYKLACNDNSMNSIMGYVCMAALLYIPLFLIALSYVCIGFALRRISHGAEQVKAMKTCTSHVILVALFYLPIIGVYTAALTTPINTNVRIINTALTQTIPPMLNPIIYTLKTEEVLQSIKVLYKRTKMAANLTSLQSVSSANATFIRPSSFYIVGLYSLPLAKYYYVFLCVVYAVTVLGNSFIMGTIYLARTLHTAKYIAVFNLALSDLCGSSALIPKLLDMFLFENQYIPYEACLANMFFVYVFMTLQSLTLLAMAYDRLIAICLPLRYHAIVTKTAMTSIICVMWILSMGVNGLLVGLVTRLSFCRSTTVNSYFCDHAPVYRLACNDNSMNSIMGYVCMAALLYIPLFLIALSYVCIGFALRRISHGAEQVKAMKTCTSHVILVALFYLPIIGVYTAALTTPINTNVRIINTALTQTIPPMLNPIIYTLKTEEVLQSIKVLYKRTKVNSRMERAVKAPPGVPPCSPGVRSAAQNSQSCRSSVPPDHPRLQACCGYGVRVREEMPSRIRSRLEMGEQYYYVFLCVVYAVTVLGNSFIMGTIYLARTLHTAKYIAVFNLALSDLCGSSALIPKLLDMFLFENQYIPYEACLANMFFVFFFMGLESLSLLALGYDRLVAICLPLRYHAIVTKAAMTLILGVMWILSVLIFTLSVALITRLSFCRSTTVDSYFCDHGPIHRCYTYKDLSG
ncbi:hypothetical protein NFI96_009930 [Prochilodus magdalenae]|nr:hypothetical protein NFI96_009930 [Prochilodus magdalenae]